MSSGAQTIFSSSARVVTSISAVHSAREDSVRTVINSGYKSSYSRNQRCYIFVIKIIVVVRLSYHTVILERIYEKRRNALRSASHHYICMSAYRAPKALLAAEHFRRRSKVQEKIIALN